MGKDIALKNFLRSTKSFCPVCMDMIDAKIIEDRGKIYLEKECFKHGSFTILISEYAGDYKELSSFYYYFIPDTIQQKEYYLNVTTRCNINCQVCYLRYCDTVDELSLERVKEISGIKNIKRFTFSHGEPTVSDNLFNIIRDLKKQHKIVNIHTNGIRIADFCYASSLKSAGIDHVSLQFDGFSDDIIRDIRNEKLLKNKQEALANLKKLSIPVTLNITILKGVNEYEIGKIFDYAVKEHFIKDISFITYSHYESGKTNLEKYIMPDELIKYIENYSKGRISRRDIVLFQKLFYAYMSVFQKRKCFYYYHFLVVRTKKGYKSINEFVDLEKCVRFLNLVKVRKRKLSRLVFLKILFQSLKIKNIFLLFPQGIIFLFKGGYPSKPNKLLMVTFATICDPYKYDSTIARNCGQGIIGDKNIYDSYGTYLMQQMRISVNRL